MWWEQLVEFAKDQPNVAAVGLLISVITTISGLVTGLAKLVLLIVRHIRGSSKAKFIASVYLDHYTSATWIEVGVRAGSVPVQLRSSFFVWKLPLSWKGYQVGINWSPLEEFPYQLQPWHTHQFLLWEVHMFVERRDQALQQATPFQRWRLERLPLQLFVESMDGSRCRPSVDKEVRALFRGSRDAEEKEHVEPNFGS
jgi:hypothetical protein